MNHYKGVADMPNVAPREVFGDRGGHFGEGLMVEMTAMSDIQPGEQLLFDYGPHYRCATFSSGCIWVDLLYRPTMYPMKGGSPAYWLGSHAY